MAKPTNVQDRYNITNGVREDLIDKITNVDPEETPVMSAFGRTIAKQTYHEYQRDTYRAANADNAAIDGDDATVSARTDTSRLGNYAQIFQETIGVTGRAEEVDKAGRKSQMAYNKAKATIEVKKDIEAMLLSNNVAVSGSSGVASKSAGLGVHLFTNASHGTGGATAAHTSGAPTTAPTAGTNRAFTEPLLKASSQACFNSSGKAPPMVVMSASHKQSASTFAGISTQSTETGKKAATIVGAADYYLSDFGLMAFVPHYILATRSEVFGLDPKSNKLAYLRSWRSAKLAKTGDSEREQMLVDLTLEVKSEKNQFKIANLIP